MTTFREELISNNDKFDSNVTSSINNHAKQFVKDKDKQNA